MNVKSDSRFVACPSWEPGTLVSDEKQFFIIVSHDKGSTWQAFGSHSGRTFLSELDTDIRTENVVCGDPGRA